MQENCPSIAVLRNTETILKEKGLLNYSTKKKQFTNSGAQISNHIHNQDTNGHTLDGKIELGKRSGPDNGHEQDLNDSKRFRTY